MSKWKHNFGADLQVDSYIIKYIIDAILNNENKIKKDIRQYCNDYLKFGLLMLTKTTIKFPFAQFVGKS